MKTTHRSIAVSIPILILLLLLSLEGHAAIARLGHQVQHPQCRQIGLPVTTYKTKKAGLFPRLAAKLFQHKAKPQDAQKASRRAKTGFWLFIASNILPFFGLLLGASDPVVLAIALSLLLASIILSIIVLIKEDNPLSRMLANIVLLLTGIGLLISIAAYFVVLRAAD